MAGWNLAYDYAATFLILLIAIWYMTGKKIPIKAHKVFFVLITMICIATVTEIVATHICMNLDAFGKDALYFAVAFQNLALNLAAVILAYYILLLGNIGNNYH